MCKIIIVDDTEEIREVLNVYFSDKGHFCAEACNGTQALQIMNDEKFDMVITDIHMPDMDGITFIEELSKKECSCPVMLMTGDPIIDSREKAVRIGAQGYIGKPFSFHDISKEFDNILSEHGK